MVSRLHSTGSGQRIAKRSRPNRLPLAGCTVLLFVGLSAGAGAADAPSPFVAGFERFARYGDIDPITAGRLLIVELSCTACHESEDAQLLPKRGPRLDGAGNRLQHDWITGFLSDPQRVKPGTTMPAMLRHHSEAERRQIVQALSAFLSSLEQPFPELKGSGAQPVPHEFWNLGDPREGRQLYHRVGCVACHAADPTYETVAVKPTPLDEMLSQLDQQELEEAGLLSAARRVESVPVSDAAYKYTAESLTHFLLNPHRARPGGRMPDFQLGVIQAADIAAWLLQKQPGESHAAAVDSAVINPSMVIQGKASFRRFGCANCHAAAGVKSQPSAIPLAQLDFTNQRSCTSPADSELPHFSLDARQLEAIRAAISQSRSKTETSTPAAALQLTTLSLNCLACHERHKQGGVGRYRKAYFETYGHVDIGDEGRLPPPLTSIGRKLKRSWIEQVLQGKGRVRRYMRMRMPVFGGERFPELPALLSDTNDQSPQPSEQDVFGDHSELAEAGRQLLDVGCVQCHSLTGEALPGVIGIELQGIPARVHPQWFHDFLLNPGKLKPNTRMPSFFPRGISQNQTVLAGNTERQIAAMWAYLKQIDHLPLPRKLQQARARDYELQPVDRPQLLRTFMDQAGTHAIAVGFPAQVHFAFDAEQCRLASAWRGRFIDAEGTWFVRFAPPAHPLGTDHINFPRGVPLAFLADEAAEWPEAAAEQSKTRLATSQFRGYRLDSSGVPTFLYRIGPIDIEDRVQPQGRKLHRRLRLTRHDTTPAAGQLWLRAHQGRTLHRTGPASCRSDSGLTVSLDDSLAASGSLRSPPDGMEWIVPVSFHRQQMTIKVHYQW